MSDRDMLYLHALRGIKKTLAIGDNNVKIELSSKCRSEDIKKYIKYFELKKLTKLIRKKFPDYNVKSQVKGDLILGIKKMDLPCTLFYKLNWNLIFEKKI